MLKREKIVKKRLCFFGEKNILKKKKNAGSLILYIKLLSNFKLYILEIFEFGVWKDISILSLTLKY